MPPTGSRIPRSRLIYHDSRGQPRKRERYEELFHILERTAEENLEMAECCLSLIEEGVFHADQTQRVRQLLKRVDAQVELTAVFNDLSRRLAALDR